MMYGAIYAGVAMPALADDPHVPPLAKALAAASVPAPASRHAWSARRRPLVYRVFMPDASPSAIAVALPDGLSYCFDAGRWRSPRSPTCGSRAAAGAVFNAFASVQGIL